MDLLSSVYGFAVCLLVFAFGFLLLFFYNTLNRLRRNPITMERRRTRKKGRDLFYLLCALVFFFAGTSFFNFALFLQTYSTFVIGEPIASVSVVHHDKEKKQFIVKITELGDPLSHKVSPIENEFLINGDHWMLTGHIIRFEPWLSFLGFKPVYQLSRIQGSYYSIEDEKQNERSVFTLIDPAEESWWKWLYEYSDSLPFMEMHGSAVSQDARNGNRYIVTVLPTGFSLKKADE